MSGSHPTADAPTASVHERSAVIGGWRGTLTDVAVLAGRMGEALGGSAVVSVTIALDDGRHLEFAGPNQLRAVADTVDVGSITTLELRGTRTVDAATGASDTIVATASRVNERWRGSALELQVIAATPSAADRLHERVMRAAREPATLRRRGWVTRALGRPPFSLRAPRRVPPTRLRRIADVVGDLLLEGIGNAIVGGLVLLLWYLLS